MFRLIPAVAVASALLVSAAQAQTVGDDVTKQLWCGTALVVAYGSVPADIDDPQLLADVKTFTDAGNGLIDQATQAHLDAGFTQEAVDKIKADLVVEITPIVTEGGDPSKAAYTFEDCIAILPPPADASSSAPAM
jgi:hypothetical protein